MPEADSFTRTSTAGALSVKGGPLSQAVADWRTTGGVLTPNDASVCVRTSEILARLVRGGIEGAVCARLDSRDRSQTVTVVRINLRDLKI